MAEVHEIAPKIYRIAHYSGDAPLEFTQFLIDDDRPLLFHTGQKALFPDTLEAVKSVIDPANLAYISYSHVEADECGAMKEFLQVAPNAEVVHGTIAQMIGQSDFFDRDIHAMQDDQVLDLGEKKLRFLVTPHVPHAWDAILVFEDTTQTLFCSDLFTVFGKDNAVTETDLIERAISTANALPGYLPIGPHTNAVFDRLIALQPKALAGHHSPTYIGDAVKALDDLRGELLKSAGLDT